MTDPVDLARSAAVVVSGADRDTLVVTGPDRSTWLQGLLTCELANLTPGVGTWGLVLNRQGKIQSDVWVAASAEALWLSFAPGTGATMHHELGRMLIMEDAELQPAAERHTWFSLHGPDAAACASSWAKQAAGVSASIDFTGLGGAALVVPSASERVVLAQREALLLDAEGWTRLRLERAVPEFNVDFDASDRPHEAALDRRAISWTKGCYLGQEVVCMQDMRGKVKRSLRVFRVDAPRATSLVPGGKIVAAAGGREIGVGTSAAYSERAGAWLVMAGVQLEALGSDLCHVSAAGSYETSLAELL